VIDLSSIVLPEILDPLLGGIAAAGGGDDNRWMRLLGRLHPLIVHFPIGLAITAAVVELVNIIRRRRDASPFAFTATGIAAGTAIVAAFFGWLNADYEGATEGTTLFLHRWLGIIAAGGLSIVFLAGLVGRSGVRITAFNGYRWGLLICAVVLAVGSHFGGEMVYGKGYLTKVIFASSDKPADTDTDTDTDTGEAASNEDGAPGKEATPATDASKIDFRRDVLPIFEARCVECHGPDKVKGDLRLDTEAAIFAGDPEWWTVLWGDPDHSLLLERVMLPADDPDSMPPDGERLTAAQVATIRTWIETGDAGAEDVGGEGKVAVDPKAAPPAAAPDDKDVNEVPAAITAAAEKLRQRGVLAMRIAQNSDDWEVNASLVSPPFADADFELLKGLEPVLVQASFNRSEITDAGLEGLLGFDRLNSLRLAQTGVGDGAVDSLLRLEGLEILNLYGTNLSDTGLSRLVSLPNLKRIYCADTSVTPDGVVAAMKSADSDLDVIGPEAVSPAAVGDPDAAAGEPASP
jgi:uncharacterized membrane protein/mono/diheme cytochrome c family protein